MADCCFITDGVFRFGNVGEGTYRNPVIYADVPDMSVTRAGEYYYMIRYHYAFNARWTCYEIKRLGELGNSELCLR